MTGGHGRALAVNDLLARVAEKRGIAMGVGSQRAALRDPMLVPTYSVVRESAPTAFIGLLRGENFGKQLVKMF